jgi:phosphatidylglycerophosphate synthase
MRSFIARFRSVFTMTLPSWVPGRLVLLPNLVTLVRIVLAAPMCWAFATDRLLLGLTMFLLGAATDYLDGALARTQQKELDDLTRLREQQRHVMFRRGNTWLGKLLDPLSDKVYVFAALFPLGWDRLDHYLLGITFTLAALTTGLRPILKWLTGHEGAANDFGKMKFWVELATILSLLLPLTGLPGRYVPNGFLGVALLLAILSAGAQIMTAFGNKKTAL